MLNLDHIYRLSIHSNQLIASPQLLNQNQVLFLSLDINFVVSSNNQREEGATRVSRHHSEDLGQFIIRMSEFENHLFKEPFLNLY